MSVDPPDAARFRTALAAVVEDQTFVRSPALTRLLTYLVDAAIKGEGKALKSYSVAVDGMGKRPDYDSQIDTYARVLVMRLRKALDSFYASAGADLTERLVIDSGSYEVRLAPHAVPGAVRPQPTPTPAAPPARRRRKLLVAAIVLAAALLGAALIARWNAASSAQTVRWRTGNFPVVEVNVTEAPGQAVGGQVARQMRQSIMMNLDDYEGIRVAYKPSTAAHYAINVELRRAGAGVMENLMVIDKRTNRLIWSESNTMAFAQDHDDELSSDPFLSRSIFYAVHPTGIIHSSERKRNYAIDTPFGCWLRFSGLLQNNHRISDREISRCTRDWYAAAPNHPLAAALYGWMLTDESITQLTESGHRKAIRAAVDLLENAIAMNPRSPTLRVALMRAYACADDVASVRAAAQQVLELNPYNLDLRGATGLLLTLQNDPTGEPLLKAVIAEHFNPPPWYFVGPFVSAMMRDDPAAAGQALARLDELHHSVPIHAIFSSAYLARSGKLDQARAEWQRAAQAQPILKLKPEMFFARLPMSPEVRGRLRQWLDPVVGRQRAE